MRIFTTYLVETKKSDWELDWTEFRLGSYSAQTKPSSIIFLLLNAINIVFVFMLVLMYPLNISSIAGPIAAFGVFVATELLIYLMGFHSLFYDENKIVERWKVLNK
jgi:hypothetical protein